MGLLRRFFLGPDGSDFQKQVEQVREKAMKIAEAASVAANAADEQINRLAVQAMEFRKASNFALDVYTVPTTRKEISGGD